MGVIEIQRAENDARYWMRHIPKWHPTTTNTLLSTYWGKRTKLKNRDADMIWAYFQNVPAATCKRRVGLEIGLGHKQRGADPDAHWKSLLDALVKNKLLVDDSKEWVELSPVIYFRAPDAKKTIITLQDI